MSFLSSVAKSSAVKNLQANVLSALRGRLSAWGLSTPLGSLGDIVFEVSSRRVVTFDNLKRTTKARVASHDIIGEKPVIEFLGADGEEITFSMKFHIGMGVTPAEEVDKVRRMCERGAVNTLIIGNEIIGAHMWIITDVGESVDTVDNMGRVIVTQIDVTLKEYVEAMT